jgi:hypothetical protein
VEHNEPGSESQPEETNVDDLEKAIMATKWSEETPKKT